MCYGKPEELLAQLLQARPLKPNQYGHTALEDFEHFCAYSGCDPNNAWAKLAFVTASLPSSTPKGYAMSEELEKQCADIGMLLRDHPPGTTADIAEYCVVYWDGDRLIGAHLSTDHPGEPDEPFDVDEVLPEIPECIEEWLKAPKYTFRPTIVEWMKDSPPRESGA
jgi:hypothetical protein